MNNKPLVVAIGSPGTGKTLCPVAIALEKLYAGKTESIYLTKPSVEVGNSLGFLPGKAGDKLAPYMESMLGHVDDLVGNYERHKLLSNGKIQCLPLQYMRGVNLDNCIIIADEFQNCEYVAAKTLLSRLKPNAKLIITADPGQCDLSSTDSFVRIMDVLRRVKSCGFVEFGHEDIMRSGLVKEIVMAFSDHESQLRKTNTLKIVQ
jgi:phosphate starvation-inducible PhoH-like protein